METAFVFGLAPWKGFIRSWLPHAKIYCRHKTVSWLEFRFFWARMIRNSRSPEVYVWGYKHPPFIEEFCRRHGVPFIRIEDGFIRSVALGATKAPPLSLCFDSPVLYYDPGAQSQLERILETYDFSADPTLLLRAQAGIERLIGTRLSKYNTSKDVDIESIYGPKNRKRVLVVGQVEDDMSILKGCELRMDNNELVRFAARENPDAHIIYKPHPEVLHGTRPARSRPEAVKAIAQVLDQDISLADAFETIDHVYTMTSLSGFEALIRGIKVTCLGMPFYAGWGLTDDRQQCSRRSARRTVEEVFAAAYILYPRYFHPEQKKAITFEEALELLHSMKRAAVAAA
ncbi:capsular polysaccharide biosynthesis protein [Sinorhizobium medicae]|uniref:capsular polysaccharide export protein, LipB/KpsS family n=1 Tax=Sinorhizobium medicae TaxID=110321 RepID=UPI000FDA2E88|nr:capsular polysaccharide biosynthesis protein [Sinorhizobium medicae]MDX0604955.1 capsular polysaccharide biosynthesis protein [Sinorhizobium medicae]MDX0821231.1 capsular polysaccharide biosynthesis protein [Sinorhizobium medicae]MDX0864262.1 capsular polysaccharide biosynthesis protein [Sinorhizobium medicae]RVJ25870.1 capsular polysaccharide biosynthesis protein [Sinorhizobium medicae]